MLLVKQLKTAGFRLISKYEYIVRQLSKIMCCVDLLGFRVYPIFCLVNLRCNTLWKRTYWIRYSGIGLAILKLTFCQACTADQIGEVYFLDINHC